MAYNPYEEDEEKQAQTGGAQAAAPVPTAYAPTPAVMPSNSNRFVNFSSYFNANNAGQAGDALVTKLDSAASGAQTGAATARQDITTQAAASTIAGPGAEYTVPKPPPKTPKDTTPGTTYGTVRQAVATGSPLTGQAQTQAGQTYKGPTTEGVYQTFDPYMQQASKASRDINNSQDAAGVRAYQGGTGFDATLASQGAGGRKSDLKRKYAGLMGSAEADRQAAWEAANAAEGASATALGQWKDAATQLGAEDVRRAGELTVEDQVRDSKRKAGARVEKERANPGRLNQDERTTTLSDEIYALSHGMTLEEWIRAGKPDLQHATPEDIKKLKGGG